MGGEPKFSVQKNKQLGRFLVASKDLEAGELILEDKAFVAGPKPGHSKRINKDEPTHVEPPSMTMTILWRTLLAVIPDMCLFTLLLKSVDTPPLCLSCYSAHDGSYFCSKCSWPVCNAECETQPIHADNECKVFAQCKVKFQPVEDYAASCTQMDWVTPLRLLLEKERNPQRWDKEMSDMEYHSKARQEKPTWGVDQINIVNFLADHCKLGERFDKELIQRACGILEVNAVEVPSRSGYSIRAIYPTLSVAAHSCVPNIVHTISTTSIDIDVKVRAAIRIKQGDRLHLCYTYPLSPTLVRREFLRESKFFDCTCERCADPTELKSHLSTLRCNKCEDGIITSANPLDSEAKWKCSKCEFTTSTSSVRKVIAVIQAEIDQVDMLEPSPDAVQQREALLKKYRSVFHPKHALLIHVKHSLAQLYGRVEEYGIEELPDIMLERKVEMCREVLSVIDIVAPGETRMRGMLLYELHAPIMFLARNEFKCGIIKGQKLRERMEEPIRLLEEAAKILGREDPQSPEGMLAQVANQSALELKASVDSLPDEDD